MKYSDETIEAMAQEAFDYNCHPAITSWRRTDDATRGYWMATMRAAIAGLESTDEQKALRADAAPQARCAEPDALLVDSLKAFIYIQEYIGAAMRPIPGWDWYDVSKKIAEAYPDNEWAKQFFSRDRPGGQYDKVRES